ncbi:MAG: DNA alkylation repair protein [Flavobacteriales bacterium]
MAVALKLIYNEAFFEQLIGGFAKVNSNFSIKEWNKRLYTVGWENMELKERMRHIAITMHSFLDPDFKVNHKELLTLFKYVQQSETMNNLGFELMFFPDFIEVYGLNDFKESVVCMEEITKKSSCEFAVRPFLKKYPTKMLDQMKTWSTHDHAMVRRLATEGCRPRLPWAMALEGYKKDPNPILSILEQLKNDESESVRRSVANNINDIAKDHPELVCDLLENWKGYNNHVDWVVKHGARTLLKQGNTRMMTLFGYCSLDCVEVSELNVISKEVVFGNPLEFEVKLKNLSSEKIKIRLEYGIYFLKANGSLSRKVFKWSEREWQKGECNILNKKHMLKAISTRKYYSGLQEVSLIINGVEVHKKSFELLNVKNK